MLPRLRRRPRPSLACGRVAGLVGVAAVAHAVVGRGERFPGGCFGAAGAGRGGVIGRVATVAPPLYGHSHVIEYRVRKGRGRIPAEKPSKRGLYN